jgi:hypothetical protein
MVKEKVAFYANAMCGLRILRLRMGRPAKIHQGKTPNRLHFIPEWAEKRQMTQADIVRELKTVDKSSVSRWFAGHLPSEKHLVLLAGIFGLKSNINALFRHPDDDWIAKLFADRSRDEQERMRRTLETAFPPKQSAT